MRCFVLSLSICALVLVSTACKEMHLRSQVNQLLSSVVVLPKNVLCINGEKIFPMPDSLRKKAKLIVYVDSVECGSCRLSKMPIYERIIPEASSYGVNVMILMANRMYSGVPLIQYVSDINLGIQIYVDEDNTFLQLNPAVNHGPQLHTFLVNKKGRPVLVGDPVLSQEVAELFKRAIRQLD